MYFKNLSKYNIILGSGSPRRQQFLKELNIPFTIQLKNTDESYPNQLKGVEIAEFLAKLKADAFKDTLTKNDVLITADTIVWLDNKSLAKAATKKEGVEMLKTLSGKTHEVISACCLTTYNSQKIFNEVTKVTFKNLTDKEIEYYITHYKPYDKAGCYGIQEWIGYIGIEKIEGSFYNVMGFPIFKLYQALSEL